jgi:hypothetical protein
MTPEDLGRLFESFKRSAFRLECRRGYFVTEDDEREAFERFRNKNPAPSSWLEHREWFTTVRSAVARGAVMQRVRLVDPPLSPYQEFQFKWSYPYNERAGEQIFVMVDSPIVSVPRGYEHDFWLFDDATVVLLNYDNRGRFLGVQGVEDVERYSRIRDSLLANALPLRQYDPDQYPIKRRGTARIR